MLDRLLSLLVALSLAFLVWLYARSRDQEVLDNVPVPVQLALTPGQSEHYDLEVNGPLQVTVSFKGPPSRIRELRTLLNQGDLQVNLTLGIPDDRVNETRYSDTVRVDSADIPAPPGVSALVIEGRNRIPVTLYKLVERRLPIRLDPVADERISQVVFEPPTVLVRGPQEILDRTLAVPTRPFTLSPPGELSPGQETAATGPIPLVRELEGRPIRVRPATVKVRLTLRPRQKVYELADVPLEFLCPPNFPLRARFVDDRGGKVSLRLIGPAMEEPPAVLAFIDLGRRQMEPGLYADEPVRLQLPKDFQLAQDPPRSGAFQLETNTVK